MNVTQVARRFVREEWGGTETAILETSRRLLDAGHDTSIVCPNALAATNREQMDGVEVFRKPYFYPYLGLNRHARTQMDYKGGNLFSFALWRHLTKIPSLDIIHAHTGKRLGGIVRHTAKKLGIPYVLSLHGGLHDVPAEQMEQLIEPTKGAIEWGKLLGWWVGSRKVIEDAGAILCVGQREQELTQERFPDKRVLYFPNGVSPERYATGDRNSFRQLHGIPDDAFLVVMVGRLDPQKNQAMAIDAIRRLRDKHPNIYLLMIGHVTDPNYRTELQWMIDQSACPGRIALIPGLDPSNNALVDAYHAADLFVLTSKHEPFGIVILEAWAANLPVIATRVGGIRALIEDGVDGATVESEDSAALAGAISNLIESPDQRRTLAENGRNKAIKQYSWKHIADRLVHVYQEVIDEHKRRN
jgi:glycosyltransferase involved in cell wall biosynthesis